MDNFKFDYLNREYETLKSDGDFGLSALYIGIDVMNACANISQDDPDGDMVTLFHMLIDVAANCVNGARSLMPMMTDEQRDTLRSEVSEDKAGVQPVVRCKDCIHKPKYDGEYQNGFDILFPDNCCPLKCEDGWYNSMPTDDWFCANGERKEKRERTS